MAVRRAQPVQLACLLGPLLLATALPLLPHAVATRTTTPEPLIVHSPQVLMPWKYALTPCVCAGGALDCHERGKQNLTKEARCLVPVHSLNLNDNLLTAYPNLYGVATVVNISRNRFSAFPPKDSLTKELTKLDVSENAIDRADKDLEGFEYLAVLNVSGNKLTHLRFLPETCHLKILAAQRNRINTLEGPLNSCIHLKIIDLSSNNLTIIPERFFSSMSYLQELHLSWNPLHVMSTNVFDGLTHLSKLYMNNINLYFLPDGLFHTQERLEHLELAENALSSLPEQILSALSKLTYLNLANNRFTTIPPGFETLRALKKLEFSCNKLTTLPEMISNLTSLRDLSVEYNNIASVSPVDFSKMRHLEVLRLGANPVAALPDGFLSGARLQAATLALQASQAPQALQALAGVRSVVFTSGSLAALPAAAFQPLAPSLRALTLKRVPLQQMHADALQGLSALRYCSISFSQMAALSAGVFRGLHSLEAVELMANPLAALPRDVFQGLVRLKAIVLVGNNLTDLPVDIFGGLPALERLDLSRNQLTSLSAHLFHGLGALRELYVEHNRLTSLPPYDRSLHSLRDISFAHNRIQQAGSINLRDWMMSPHGERYLNLGVGNRLGLDNLKWLLTHASMGLAAHTVDSCNCGSARHRQSLLRLCVDMQCKPNDPTAPQRCDVNTSSENSIYVCS